MKKSNVISLKTERLKRTASQPVQAEKPIVKTIQTKGKKDATIRLEMEQEILGISRRGGYTMEEALRIVVPHEANGDHCAHCHGIFHKAWDSLVRKGYIERAADGA